MIIHVPGISGVRPRVAGLAFRLPLRTSRTCRSMRVLTEWNTFEDETPSEAGGTPAPLSSGCKWIAELR
jgi:hypothetical protein